MCLHKLVSCFDRTFFATTTTWAVQRKLFSVLKSTLCVCFNHFTKWKKNMGKLKKDSLQHNHNNLQLEKLCHEKCDSFAWGICFNGINNIDFRLWVKLHKIAQFKYFRAVWICMSITNQSCSCRQLAMWASLPPKLFKTKVAVLDARVSSNNFHF